MIDSQVQKEAIEWFARSRSDEVSEQEQAELTEWLTLSESHQIAYDQVKLRWASMDVLKTNDLQALPSHKDDAQTKSPAWTRQGFAAAALLVMTVALTWLAFDANQGYTTAVGEQRRVLLADGSTVHLNTNTAIKVAMSKNYRKIILEKGEVLCHVAKNPARPFTVIAGKTEVVALGTLFSVYRAPKNTLVTVVEGRVSVTPNSSQRDHTSSRQTVVSPGEQVIVPRGSSITQDPISIGKPIIRPDWDNGLLVFDQTPLDDVVGEISRYFPGELRLGSDVPVQPVTGTFKLRDRNVLLETLSQSYSLRAVELDGITLLISEKVDP